MLEVQKFIRDHLDWEAKLSVKPYCLTITHDEVCGHRLVMLKYSQIESDFNEPIVRECRGLILDKNGYVVVSFPFTKFFNYGEPLAAQVDWATAFVSEKLDGSIIKLVRLGNDFLISTNGTIDAFKAPIADQIGCTASNFGELAMLGFKHYGIEPEHLKNIFDEGYTYMFELTSPFNKVVVQWPETKMNFIGCRDNKTGREFKFYQHVLADVFDTPKLFSLESADECVKAAEMLPTNAEGYVVCDASFNRIKIKSPMYVALHHMQNNGMLTYDRAIDIVRNNEIEEVSEYFPEFVDNLNKVKEDWEKLLEDAKSKQNDLKSFLASNPDADRKSAALFIIREMKTYSSLAFNYLDKKIVSFADELIKMPAEKIAKILGYKNS